MKKVLSLLLTVIMVVSMMVITAHAEETPYMVNMEAITVAEGVSTSFTAIKDSLTHSKFYFETKNGGKFNILDSRIGVDGDVEIMVLSATSFGEYTQPFLSNDKFKQYIDFIDKMRDWYKKGLIDKNYSTNNTSILDSNMTSGKSGACYGYIGSYMGKYLSAMEGTGFDLVATPFPVIKKGDKTNFAVINPIGVGVSSLGITPSCKNPVKAVEWADNWYSLEGAKLKMFGVEGNTYNMVDGKPVYTDKIMNNPEGLSVSEAMNRSFRTGSMPALFSEEFEKEYFDQFYSYQQQKDALELYSSYSYTKKSVMPFVSPTVEESEEFAAISADIGTYVSEMINKFICGDKPIEEYDDFRDNLKKMNVERYIELRQAAYDRYLKR